MERSQILAFSDDLTLGDNHMDHANSSDASPGIQPSLDAFQTFFDEQTLLPNYLGDELWPTGLSPRGFTYHSPDAPTNQPGVETAQHHQQVNRPVDISDTRQTACLDDANDAATASLLGSSGDMDPLVLQHYQYDSSGRFRFKNLEVQSVAAMGPPVQFILSQPSIFTSTREETGSYETPPQVLRDELESVVPKDIGIRIIDLFKRIVPPHYPIFTSSDPLTPDITPASLLASIYLISEPFTKFDERLCIDLAYEKPSSAMLYRIINKALAYQVHAPTLETLQAMLLLVLRPHPSPIVLDSGFKWNQLATVVACAQSLGLHLDPSAWKIPAAQIAQRRRVSCCVYSVDKWLALSLGRPPLLNHDTWLVTAPGLEDRIGSGLDSSKWERVMQRGELTVLLDRVLTQL